MKRSRRTVGHLPDEMVVEILSRLPAYEVLKFRRVCQRWKALISARYFADIHLKHSDCQMILAEENADGGRKLLLIDKREPPRRRSTIRKLCLLSMPYSFSLSYHGLIAVGGYYPFSPNMTDSIIFNPITRDKVRILSRTQDFNLCGMFFNPLVKEYCTLWVMKRMDVEVKMLHLGPKPCFRDLKKSTSSIYWKRLGGFAPVVMEDTTLYWMAGGWLSPVSDGNMVFEEAPCEEVILAFDIKTEEFAVMPHPGPTYDCEWTHSNMNIFKIDDSLCFVEIANKTQSVIINMWTLKDSVTRSWIKSHNIIIDEHLGKAELQPMAFSNGDLLIQYLSYRGAEVIYACSLEQGSLQRLGRRYDKCSKLSDHNPSFVSLSNCKSEICLEETPGTDDTASS